MHEIIEREVLFAHSALTTTRHGCDNDLLPPPVAYPAHTGARGAEGRRHLLNYLRQHLEELRPYAGGTRLQKRQTEKFRAAEVRTSVSRRRADLRFAADTVITSTL